MQAKRAEAHVYIVLGEQGLQRLALRQGNVLVTIGCAGRCRNDCVVHGRVRKTGEVGGVGVELHSTDIACFGSNDACLDTRRAEPPGAHSLDLHGDLMPAYLPCISWSHHVQGPLMPDMFSQPGVRLCQVCGGWGGLTGRWPLATTQGVRVRLTAARSAAMKLY